MKRLASVLLLTATSASAQQTTIRLVCANDYSIDGDAKVVQTTGSFLVTVQVGADGRATLKKQDFGAVFTATVSEEQISGEVEYELGGLNGKQIIVINRFTGEFHNTISYDGKSGLVFFGACRRADQPLF
jgi:hypothetical protein